ncbi:hypothetical protein [Bradyrhizobium sp. Arg816]|uniref:hypothetical protein n=1 Tax=Bradyrhizobium sp. Arg816 TaxID=2998491 RepID=UPI00249E877B|nr:hypothetical protein [Bradyrhizobium sp. Arg816]MDI3563735.1 hypothetical protein [Bradyrhizobium sp. Arg816]
MKAPVVLIFERPGPPVSAVSGGLLIDCDHNRRYHADDSNESCDDDANPLEAPDKAGSS